MDEHTQMPPYIRQFLTDLLDEAEMATLTQDERDIMIDELYERLDALTNTRMLEELEPDDLDIYLKMTEDGKSAEELGTFLRTKIPDLDTVMKDAFVEFRNMYLEKVTTYQTMPSANTN